MQQLKITKSITIRESEAVNKYLQDISKEPVITPSEEVLLAKRIRQGDEIALKRLINANLRFVVSVAKQYQNSNISLLDLINEGNYGLIKAAKKFDETRGFKFISYAVWWIRQQMLMAINEQTIVHLPQNKKNLTNKIKRIQQDFEQKNEREPTNEEITECLKELNIDIDSVSEIQTLFPVLKKHISLDAPLKEDEASNYYDILPSNEESPEEMVMSESDKEEIRKILNFLNEKEKMIIELSFGLKDGNRYTYQEISEKLDLSRERVRQIIVIGIRKLRRPFILRRLRKNFPR